MKIFNVFKKKEVPKHILFGRVQGSSTISTCDVCKKQVGFTDYVYLCRNCRDSLPEYAQNNHHWLLPYPEARSEYLKQAIIQAKEQTK